MAVRDMTATAKDGA